MNKEEYVDNTLGKIIIEETNISNPDILGKTEYSKGFRRGFEEGIKYFKEVDLKEYLNESKELFHEISSIQSGIIRSRIDKNEDEEIKFLSKMESVMNNVLHHFTFLF